MKTSSMNISDSKLKTIVWGVTILIPVVVTILAYLPGLELSPEAKETMYQLPKLNAIINGTAFVTLIGAWFAIKNKNVALHKRLTSIAVILSVLFLLSYIAFHFTTEPTHYCGDGAMKCLYFFVLISHIVLSVPVLPLALFSIYRGMTGEISEHKRIVKWTFPIWMYVAITGVMVYLFMAPYY